MNQNNEPPHARVFMFANDYTLKQAYEPVDDPTGQIDTVSSDAGAITSTRGHSFALRAAKDIADLTTGTVTLIPCPKGATSISQWRKPADPFDRGTLFGSCNYRRLTAAPGGVTALWWYQGESDNGSSTFLQDHTALINEFRSEMGASLPVIYVQLARHTSAGTNSGLHRIGELQRQMESGSGSLWALPSHHMVVAFDLPLGEPIHLNQAAQKELGRRIALATRQHVYGEDVDGTGPRLVAVFPVIHPGGDRSRIKVRFNKPVNSAINNYDNQFRVFDNGAEMAISSVVRDPGDDTAVLITLTTAASGTVTVSYGDVAAPGLGVSLNNVIKGENDIPAPRFGPLEVQMEVSRIGEWVSY